MMYHKTDFLQDRVLFRNDPEFTGDVEQYARTENPHAQYAMGLIYVEGRGVNVDLSVTYAWLTLAVMQGDKAAEVLRNIIGVDLSDDEFQQGKQLAAQLETCIAVSPEQTTH